MRVVFLLVLLLVPRVAWAGLSLTWIDRSDNELGFSVERAPVGGAFAELNTVPPDSTTYHDAAVVAGERYCYRVRAWNTRPELDDQGNETGVTVTQYSNYTNTACGEYVPSPQPPGGLELAVMELANGLKAAAAGAEKMADIFRARGE